MTDTPNATRGMQQLERQVGMPIAEYLRTRYEAGDSQQTIAEALGIDRATVSRWMARYGIEVQYVGRPRRRVA